MQQLVSVIIPTFNRAHLLPRALDSLLKQSYKNWEALIIDDASTDDTKSLIANYIKKDNRFHFYPLKENSGACIARNVGIKNAKGTLVTFLDSDDEYLPQKIEKQVDCLLRSEVNNIGVVSCGRQDERNGKVYFKWLPLHKGDITRNLLSKERVGANTSLLMVKKEILDQYKILFDPNMPASQDWDFLFNISQHSCFDFVPEHLVIIHHHSGERVYTGARSLVAIERQYHKYLDILMKDQIVHDKFLTNMAVQNYTNGNAKKALEILKNKILNPSLKLKILYLSIKAFPNYGNAPSKAVYKLLKSIVY